MPDLRPSSFARDGEDGRERHSLSRRVLRPQDGIEASERTNATIRGANMRHFLRNLLLTDEGQDIAEYAVMLAVILVLVVGTVRIVGSNANNAFSSVASSFQ